MEYKLVYTTPSQRLESLWFHLLWMSDFIRKFVLKNIWDEQFKDMGDYSESSHGRRFLGSMGEEPTFIKQGGETGVSRNIKEVL